MSYCKYEELDQRGRDIVKNLLFPNVAFIEAGISDRYDLESNTINGRSLIEVKYRETMLSTDNDTDFLEYEKLYSLRNEDKDANHIYIMLFKDKVARVYNLDKISIMNVFLSVPECPVSSTENKGTKEKLMIELPTNQAKTYKWN